MFWVVRMYVYVIVDHQRTSQRKKSKPRESRTRVRCKKTVLCSSSPLACHVCQVPSCARGTPQKQYAQTDFSLSLSILCNTLPTANPSFILVCPCCCLRLASFQSSKLYSQICLRIQRLALGHPLKHAAQMRRAPHAPPRGLSAHTSTPGRIQTPPAPAPALLSRPAAVLLRPCAVAPLWLPGGRVAGVALVVVRVLHLLLLGELRTVWSIYLCDEIDRQLVFEELNPYL